jgi:hypothetical protein
MDRPFGATELINHPLRVELYDRQGPNFGQCPYTFGEAEVQQAAASGIAANQVACGSYVLGWQLRAKR